MKISPVISCLFIVAPWKRRNNRVTQMGTRGGQRWQKKGAALSHEEDGNHGNRRMFQVS